MQNVRLIQSLERAFNIIDCFSINTPNLRLSDIAKQLDLNINTTRGLVNTLVYFGYLTRNKTTGDYSLGFTFLNKAEVLRLNMDSTLQSIVEPFLSEIADEFEGSARLILVNYYNLSTVLTVHPTNSRYMLVSKATGTRFPLNATASGKVYLYYMDEEDKQEYLANIPQEKFTDYTITDRQRLEEELTKIGQQGYAVELDEIDETFSSLAVPFLDENGELLGTLSFTAPTTAIQAHAQEIADEMIDFINKKLSF